MRKRGILAIGFGIGLSALSLGGQQSWNGEIGDNHCNLEHEPIAEGDPVLPSPECVKLCVKSGYKYIFILEDKAFTISNQDNADLAKFAGHEVKVTGEMKGDVLTISKIEAR
jgi:hypothetical protein